MTAQVANGLIPRILRAWVKFFRPFSCFCPRTFSHSTKSAPLFWDLSGRTGRNRPLPRSLLHSPTSTPKPRAEGRASASGALPRADRSGAETKSFCPCQKSQVSLVRYLTFSLVCGRIWQRGAAAGPPAVRVVGACSPVGCVQARPRRQPRQVLLPLPQIRRKHWVSAGFLFACVAWLCGSRWFRHQVFSSGLTRSQPFPSPPAPKTHPVSPFLAQTGCIFLFFAVFWLQNFCPGFCALCCIAFTN